MPGGNGKLRASAGTYQASGEFAFSEPRAAAVTAVARTSELFIDRNSLRATYALTDANGEPRVSRSGLSVRMVLSFADGAPTQTYSCALPDAQSGLGECSQALPTSMFTSRARSATARVSILYGSSEVTSASAGSVSLKAAVFHSALNEAGMIATLPQSPRYVDDEFEVPIRAHTGKDDFALKGWKFLIEYDASVLKLVSFRFTDMYPAPQAARDDAAGTL